MQASTTHALSGRHGDLQLCLAAYGGGDASIFRQQQLRGASSSTGWKIGRGIPFPASLPQTAGVTLRQSESLRQLMQLEAEDIGAEGLAAEAVDDIAEPAAGVLPAIISPPTSNMSQNPPEHDACSFFSAEELNPLNTRPGVAPAAAAALEELCSHVTSAAGHCVFAVSVISGHALSVALASLPYPQCDRFHKPNSSKSVCGALDAALIPTRTLVCDPLSMALQEALMIEDAASSVHPETMRQVRWLFRSHAEGTLLLRKTLNAIKQAVVGVIQAADQSSISATDPKQQDEKAGMDAGLIKRRTVPGSFPHYQTASKKQLMQLHVNGRDGGFSVFSNGLEPVREKSFRDIANDDLDRTMDMFVQTIDGTLSKPPPIAIDPLSLQVSFVVFGIALTFSLVT